MSLKGCQQFGSTIYTTGHLSLVEKSAFQTYLYGSVLQKPQ